jgi:chromosome segregation ATPase
MSGKKNVKKEFGKLTTRAEELYDKCEILDIEVEKLRNINVKLNDDMDELKKNLKKKLKDNKEKIRQLEKNIDKKETSISFFEQVKEDLKERIHELKQNIDKKEKECDQLKEDLRNERSKKN